MKILLALLSLLVISQAINGQPESMPETCLTDNDSEDRYASYSPNGEMIVFESNRSGDWDIYLMDNEGQAVERLVNNGKTNRRPSWHPNGKEILFESIEDGTVSLRKIKIKRKKEKVIKTLLVGGELVFATYSPNGKAIAVSRKDSENKSSIILLNRRGKLIKRVTNNEYRNYYPKWSGDGKELVYFSRKETANEDDEIYRINIATGEELRLTNWPKHNFCPSWSPDGKRIAYVTSMEETRPEIYTMKTDGSDKTRLTINEDGDTLPNWHPIENKILITGYRNGNYEICEITIVDK
jgi:Tol biopolymer transport system component